MEFRSITLRDAWWNTTLLRQASPENVFENCRGTPSLVFSVFNGRLVSLEDDAYFFCLCTCIAIKVVEEKCKIILSQKINSFQPSERLTSPEDIKSHEFFRDVDWEALSCREIRPPFKPRLTGLTDLRFFDKVLNQLGYKVCHFILEIH